MYRIIRRLAYFLVASSLTFSASSCEFRTGTVNGSEDDDQDLPNDTPNTPQENEDPVETSIPFSRTPEIPDYKLPQETFSDDLEKEASDIIDHAIEKAIAYVSVMKDARHSQISYSYDEDTDGYISKLSENELELYRNIVEAAKTGVPFSIKETEYDGDLKDAYFSISETLFSVEPGISSYFMIEPETHMLVGEETTRYTSVFDLYFDPYADGNKTVRNGDVTQEEVIHAAELLDRVVKRIVRFMPEDLTTYDKYYYLAAVLSEQANFDKRPDNCFTAFGALITRKAVCEGYAAAYMLLCKEANLWVGYKSGFADNGKERAGHVWNLIKLEDGIYNVDVTWSDGYGMPYERDWYDHFIKSDELFEDSGHEPQTGLASTGVYAPTPYEK